MMFMRKEVDYLITQFEESQLARRADTARA